MSQSKPKYHTVKIQDLEPTDGKNRDFYKRDPKQHWIDLKCNAHFETNYHHDEECKCTALCYLENCEATFSNHSNSFYGAFVNAYNNHEDVVLSPDDVWLVICLQFSKYINDNSEAMRHLFVEHQGKKELIVTTWKERSESQWDEFFKLMIEEIRKNTKGEIVDMLKCDFTTTGKIESILSIATVMDSFKKYLQYGRCIPCCGIRNVHFMGAGEDWENLLNRTLALEKYAVTDFWKTYIQKLQPILLQFLDTYNGKVDVDFWNKIMDFSRGRAGSGKTTKVDGWILNFFGIFDKAAERDIKGYNIDVPIKIDNQLTQIKKVVYLIGGFGGVNYSDGAYRPQMSMIVYWNGKDSTNTPMEEIDKAANSG